MEATVTIDSQFLETKPHVSEFRRIIRVMTRRWVVVIGLVIIILSIFTALFAPVLAPYDPAKTNLRQALLQPSAVHLLGTDALGRDTLSRLIYGSQVAFMVGLVATAIAASLGITL